MNDGGEKLDRIAEDVAALRGSVMEALANGARAMGELRDELRLVRLGAEDTRQRVTALEVWRVTVEHSHDERARDRRAAGQRHASWAAALWGAAAGGIMAWAAQAAVAMWDWRAR